MNKTLELVRKLRERLEQRQNQYLAVAGTYENGMGFHTSFVARAAEVGVMITDIDFLLGNDFALDFPELFADDFSALRRGVFPFFRRDAVDALLRGAAGHLRCAQPYPRAESGADRHRHPDRRKIRHGHDEPIAGGPV